MDYPKRLLDLWRAKKFGAKLRGPKTRSWEALDVWAGDTVQIEGKTFFQMPDGTLLPAIAGGGAQGWEELIDTLVADGTQVSNSTTETIVCPDFNIPAFYMAPGRVLRLTAWGVQSQVVTTPGLLEFWVRWGGVAGTVLLTSHNGQLDETSYTNAMWLLNATIVCRTAGATGTFMSAGWLSSATYKAAAEIANNPGFGGLVSFLGSAGAPSASANAAVTVDTTTAKLLSISAKFSVATSPTNLTCQGRLIEVLN